MAKTQNLLGSPDEVETKSDLKHLFYPILFFMRAALWVGALETMDNRFEIYLGVVVDVQLYDYQYNMGLLLLQRKNWSSQVDDLKSAVADSQETLDREKAAHLLDLSEAMKREEAAKKALDLERKCVNDVRFSDLLCFVVS